MLLLLINNKSIICLQTLIPCTIEKISEFAEIVEIHTIIEDYRLYKVTANEHCSYSQIAAYLVIGASTTFI